LASGILLSKLRFFKKENATCLRCHENYHYEFPNADSSKLIHKELCSNYVIDTALFYSSNHKGFKCIDCHSEEYGTYPHKATLKLDQSWACMDCHGGDEVTARYHFEEITSQFEKSVHYKSNKEAFTCWQCHDPHFYKTNARVSENIGNTVLYDNNICLSCHADINRWEILSSKIKANIVQKHDWLPNQELHFKNVRCVECHARVNDSLLVPHQILPKEKAVRRCAECHSQNSLLIASLYKYQVKKNRQEFGFLNSVILNQSFVIGANRNYYLNVISISIAIICFLGIFFHFLLRIFKSRH
jgi:predicted CXXCH cytochrome family protein